MLKVFFCEVCVLLVNGLIEYQAAEHLSAGLDAINKSGPGTG